MMKHAHSIPLETIWPGIRAEAKFISLKEPTLAGFVHNSVLSVESMLPSLGRILSTKLASADVSAKSLMGTFMSVYQAAPDLEEAAQPGVTPGTLHCRWSQLNPVWRISAPGIG